MKKISKKNLRLNKEVVASLSENEMQKVVGGQITGEVTVVESICMCKTIGEIGCASFDPGCGKTRNNCSVGCTETAGCGGTPPRLTAGCTGNGCANISKYCADQPIDTTDLFVPGNITNPYVNLPNEHTFIQFTH